MSSVESMGRMLLALAAILFVVWLITRGLRKARGGADHLLDVVARKQLTRNASVAVIRVADRALIIGITDTTVSVLGEAESATLTQLLPEAAAPAAVPTDPVPRLNLTPRRAASRARGAVSAGPLAGGALAGSALSPATWKQSIDALREMTVRGRTGS